MANISFNFLKSKKKESFLLLLVSHVGLQQCLLKVLLTYLSLDGRRELASVSCSVIFPRAPQQTQAHTVIWDSLRDLVEEQPVLLTAEPCLQTPCSADALAQ